MRLIPIRALASEKGITYSRTHLYRLMKSGGFVKPIALGGNKIAFLESEIDAWIKSKIAERDAQSEAA